MYSEYEKLILKRFLFSKKTDGYISIFSLFSIIGIMIGVGAIIIVMSVMNGFREELTSRLLGINGHINIYSSQNQISSNTSETIKEINDQSMKVFPLIETQALIISQTSSMGVYVKSYSVNDLINKNFINEKIIRGKIYDEKGNKIIIGYALANRLNLKINDKVKIAIPKSDNTLFGNIPRFKTLVVSGIFDLGMYEYDSNFIFTNLNITRKLLLLKNDDYNKIEIEVNNPNIIENHQNKIDQILKKYDSLYSISWKQSNSSLINALKVEKNVMFLILTLIILVASMNIISGLIIFVKEKNKDIGILKMIGISNFNLLKIFLTIGFVNGLIGTFCGTLFGIIFSINIQRIQSILENLFNVSLFSKEVYYLSTLPSKIDYYEILWVIIISLFISLVSTIFPAYRSSKINPIKIIKND